MNRIAVGLVVHDPVLALDQIKRHFRPLSAALPNDAASTSANSQSDARTPKQEQMTTIWPASKLIVSNHLVRDYKPPAGANLKMTEFLLLSLRLLSVAH